MIYSICEKKSFRPDEDFIQLHPWVNYKGNYVIYHVQTHGVIIEDLPHL